MEFKILIEILNNEYKNTQNIIHKLLKSNNDEYFKVFPKVKICCYKYDSSKDID